METKPALRSVTIIGAIISIVATLGDVTGYFSISAADTNGLVNDIAALIGAIMSIYGRVKAFSAISGVIK